MFTLVVKLCLLYSYKVLRNLGFQPLSKIKQSEIKSEQFADDLWVITKPEEDTLKALFGEIEEFYYFSGLQVNYQKTVAYQIGPYLRTNALYYSQKQVNWMNEPIKILGIWFHNNNETIQRLNFNDKLAKVHDILKLWSVRNLSLMEKL